MLRINYYIVSYLLYISSYYCMYVQDKKLTHRKTSDEKGAGSMFEDNHGDTILDFPCVAGFPVESMHLLDGGVFKQLNQTLAYLATRVRVNVEDPNSAEIDILATEVDDRVNFFNKFTLREQVRKLR